MTNNTKDDEMTLEEVQHMVRDVIGEKALASVMLSEAGNVIVQYGKKTMVYKNITAAKPASELLRVVSNFIN